MQQPTSDPRTITLRLSPDLDLNDREVQLIANAARRAAEQQIALVLENRRMWAALKEWHALKGERRA